MRSVILESSHTTTAAGTNGNISSLRLAGITGMRYTVMSVLSHRGSQFHGKGILPDIYVNKTIKGVKEGRDECLERANEICRKANSENNDYLSNQKQFYPVAKKKL